jgi:polyhydroxyalkanoate synthesis regulator phasin
MTNPQFLDEMTKMATSAFGMAGNVKNDMADMFRTQIEGICTQMGLAKQSTIDTLVERVAALEDRIAVLEKNMPA